MEEFTDEVVGQIWAEAVVAYASGEDVWIGKDMEQIAANVQREHFDTDDRTEMLDAWLNKPMPANWDKFDAASRRLYSTESQLTSDIVLTSCTYRNEITPLEVAIEFLQIPASHYNRKVARQVNEMLGELVGWEEVGKVSSAIPYTGRRQRGFRRMLPIAQQQQTQQQTKVVTQQVGSSSTQSLGFEPLPF
jgi:predicted P-loop ATPase